MTKSDLIEELDNLIDDEKEAIDEYNEIIKSIKSNYPEAANILNKIMEDEQKHINKLMKVILLIE